MKRKEPVDKNLASICSKLACQTISTVCDPKNIDEINREISRPKNDQFEYVEKVQYNEYFDKYLDMFRDLIRSIQRHLTDHVLLDGQITGSSGYIGELVLLKQRFEQLGQTNNIIICDYLLLLTKRYSALKDLPFDVVLNHILKQIDAYYQGCQVSEPMNELLYQTIKVELEQILQKHAEHPADNPKLDKLVSLLKQYAPKRSKGEYLSIDFRWFIYGRF